MSETSTKDLGQVIQIDDDRVRDYLKNVVTRQRGRDAQCDAGCGSGAAVNAGRDERTEARRDTRAGSYSRRLQTQAGEVTLRVPKLRQQTFETAIIERYRRRCVVHWYTATPSRTCRARRCGRLPCEGNIQSMLPVIKAEPELHSRRAKGATSMALIAGVICYIRGTKR